MKVKVVNYHPSWFDEYNKEKIQIKKVLGPLLVDIHHIGSTSVKGLKAKPIIDIMPIVSDIKKVDDYNDGFESLGYECMGELGIQGRRYFRKGGNNRTHQLHIFQYSDSYNIDRHLAVRDYLRTHDSIALEYGKLKEELANKYSDNIEKYCDGKDAFVKRLEQDALQWYYQQNGISK